MNVSPKPRGGVLVVDDEPSLRKVIGKIVVEAGYDPVFEASNGAEALSLLEANGEAILVVLLDLVMPQVSGMDVMKHLINVHKIAVGIIVVTGHGEAMAVEEFYSYGTSTVVASDYMVKPVGKELLLREIERTTSLIQAKRRHIEDSATTQFETAVTTRLDRIEGELGRLSRAERPFLAELGLDLVRALIVAAALLAFLLLGAGDFVRRVIGH